MSDDPAFEIPVGFADDVSFAVPIAHFNHGELDSPEDHIREAVAQRRPVMPIVLRLASDLIARKQVESIRAILALIVEAKKPAQRVDEIAFACGMSLADGATIISMAKKHGVSKQAFQRGVMRVSETLQLRKTRTMRDEDAREKMAATNYRQ
jgi:hypothetical protein